MTTERPTEPSDQERSSLPEATAEYLAYLEERDTLLDEILTKAFWKMKHRDGVVEVYYWTSEDASINDLDRSEGTSLAQRMAEQMEYRHE